MNTSPTEAPAAPASTNPSTPPPLEEDEIFHLLQTRRRRLALRYLRGREGPVEMRDLAEQVAAWEYDTTPEALDSKHRQRAYIPLYQTHLPRLDEAGVIEYDQARGTVEPTDRIEALYPYLDSAKSPNGPNAPEAVTMAPEPVEARVGSQDADAATAYYGGASLFGLGLVTASWAGLVAVPGLVVSMAVTALFAAVTIRIAGV